MQEAVRQKIVDRGIDWIGGFRDKEVNLSRA